MTDEMTKLLAAAGQVSGAAADMIEVVHHGAIQPHDNVGAGDTLVILADGMRLLIEAMAMTVEDETREAELDQLHAALVAFQGSGS